MRSLAADMSYTNTYLMSNTTCQKLSVETYRQQKLTVISESGASENLKTKCLPQMTM